MAGFFSLGGGGGGGVRGTSSRNNNNNNSPQDPNNPNEINPENFFLYSTSTSNQAAARNQENSSNPYNKSTFELWQYPQQNITSIHQQRQNPLLLQDLYSLALGSSSRGGGGGGGIIFEESSTSRSEAFAMMGTSTSSGGSGHTSCQDCGNQAKKDCTHMRCRSCCKSRGFECPTHVKSTWVPAAKRRERHLQQQQQQQHQQMNNTSGGRDQQIPKRVRGNNTSSTRNLPASNPSGLELANLPAEVNTSAVFRCVRVSSVDATEDQYAYQTALSIGGHMFKGILYDQGPEAQYLAGDTSSGGSGNVPQLNLTTATSTSSPVTTTASTFVGHSVYPSTYMAGMDFFHQPPRS